MNRNLDGSKKATIRLDSLAAVDPETLPGATKSDFTFKYIDISSVSTGRLLFPNVPVSFGEAPSRARRRIRTNDVLMSTVRPNLKAFAYCRLPDEPFVASTGFAVLRPFIASDGPYVFYSILSDEVARQIEAFAVGSNYPAINSSDVRRLLLPAFQSDERSRIGEILLAMDGKIVQTEELIRKYRQIKAGLMHDLFTRGLTGDGQLRPPREVAPELYKRTIIGWIPREWCVGDLKSKSSPRRAHLRTGPFGSSLKGEHWTDEGRPVITIGALGEGFLSEPELLYVSEVTASRLAEYQLTPGDIVFSRVADVGRSTVIETEHRGWIMSSNLMRISVDQGVANPKYLQQLLSHDSRMKSQIRAKVNSGGREIANSAVLNQLSFPWPELSEQNRIVKAACHLDDRIRVERNLLVKLAAEKAGVMQDLLSGNVRTCISERIHV